MIEKRDDGQLCTNPSTVAASDTSTSSGGTTPFKVQINYYIPIFGGQIDADVVDKWLNLFSIKEAIFASAKSVSCHRTSSHSKMRYCVMFLPLKFAMFFWTNLVYGNVMLYTSLGLTVLLLL